MFKQNSSISAIYIIFIFLVLLNLLGAYLNYANLIGNAIGYGVLVLTLIGGVMMCLQVIYGYREKSIYAFQKFLLILGSVLGVLFIFYSILLFYIAFKLSHFGF